MWTPPADEKINNTGWQPPTDESVATNETSQSDSGRTLGQNIQILKAASDAAGSLAPWNKANQFLKENIAGGIAEGAGYLGGKVASQGVPQLGINPSPIAGNAIQGAGVGVAGAVALSPEIIAAYSSLKGIYNSQNPTVKGLVNTPQELGPDYSAQNKAIGVTRRVPMEGGKVPQYPDPYNSPSGLSKPKYSSVPSAQPEIVNPQGKVISPVPSSSIEPTETAPTAFSRPKPTMPAEQLPSTVPTRLPSKPGDFLSYANEKLGRFGGKINPQELMDWQVKLEADMSSGVIPKYNEKGGITTIYQQASDLASRIKSVFNPIAERRLAGAELPEGTMPTRAGLDKAYGIASSVQKGTRKAIKSAGAVTGIVGLEEILRRMYRR